MASSVCQTVTADPTVYTSIVTSILTATITVSSSSYGRDYPRAALNPSSQGAPTTQTTSLPVTSIACATAAGVNGTEPDVCRTLTSFVATQTVIPVR